MENKNLYSKYQVFYEISLCLMLFYEIIMRQSNIKQLINVDLFSNTVWVIVVTLLSFKIFFTKYTHFELIMSLIISVVCILATVNSKEITMLKFMLFSIGIVGCDIQKLMLVYIKYTLFFGFFIIFLSLINVIPNSIIAVRHGFNRYDLGFSSPASVGFLCYNFFYFYLYKNYKKKNLLTVILVLFPFLILLWWIVNSKSSFIINILMIIMFYLDKRFPNFFNKKILLLSPMIISSISIFLITNYDSSSLFYREIDSLLSLRVSLGNFYYNVVGITLFGHLTKLESLNQIWLDNSYASLLLRFGVFSLILILFIYTYVLYKAITLNDSKLIIGIICSLIYGISETTLYSFGFNIVILIVMYKFWEYSTRRLKNKLDN